MVSKLWKVSLITGAIVVIDLIIWGMWPAIQSLLGIAQADPLAANFTGYAEFLGAAPMWLYGLPVVVGIIIIVLVLRAPEPR
jgi:hypothetical protein